MTTATSAVPLLADELAADPKIAQARTLIHEALDAQRGKLTGIKPADPERKQSYAETLALFAKQRGGNLWYPYLGSGFGSGPLVELADGSVKYDMIAGIGVHFFGHAHPKFVDAAIDASVADTLMQGALQQNADSAKLTDSIISLANVSGAKLDHCYLTTSGAMANENSFKMAFQACSRKGMVADRMLAFQGTFCGRTLALSSMSDKPNNRVGLPHALKVDYIPFFDESDPEGSTQRAVDRLEEYTKRWPKHYSGFKMELILGEGGFYAGQREFFLKLIEICKREGIAVIADEIQTFCRTSRPFAFQHFGLDEHVDLVNVGKSTQVCFTLFTDAWAPQPGLVAQTFTGASSSIKAAQVVIDEFANGDLYGEDGRVMQLTGRIRDRIKGMAAEHPSWVCGPYGLGAMIAFQPFDGTIDQAKAVCTELYDRGVVAFLCGRKKARVRFLPSVPAVTDAQADEVCDILGDAMAAVAAKLDLSGKA
ncbi:MAG: aminotransferase class III-fold pyridoxal phosphate-dependent enzyme [Planctomycetota bacterium]